ncbi:hypothetical protein AB6A40_008683 [Gnathostoma spinigerum]|uniref:BPTI/Kunitz inhibitor domain-containing protein n=1 Tax=Gnathostoma spinigerum TaxID=75299 RepID=A0ABD6EPS6_9BILA
MIGPPVTCPLPDGVGFKVIHPQDGNPFCDSKKKDSCPDGYECIRSIGFRTSQGDGVCCPTRETACSQEVVKSPDGWLQRWYFDGTACVKFQWDPAMTNCSANNFISENHCKSYCVEAMKQNV